MRSDGPGLTRIAAQGALIATGSGLLVAAGEGHVGSLPATGALAMLALLHVAMFAALHESGHRTAFASRVLNDRVSWFAALFTLYTPSLFRAFHFAHHRHTHQVGLDPELEDPPPSDLRSYLLEISGIPWWIGKLRGHWRGLRADFRSCPYIPPAAAAAVSRSIRRQFAVYGLLLILSLPYANGLLLWLWLLPLALAQPLLRWVLLAEHGGCPCVADPLANTRTTLTLAPLRLLMWNMPFHAEHHLFPSLPFHALPQAHRLLKSRLQHCDRGYLAVHRHLLAHPGQLSLPVGLR